MDCTIICRCGDTGKHGIYISCFTWFDISYIIIGRFNGVSFKIDSHIIKDYFSCIVNAEHNIGLRTYGHGVRHYIHIAGAQSCILLYRDIHDNALFCVLKFRAVIFFFYCNAIGTLVNTCFGCKTGPDLCTFSWCQGIDYFGSSSAFCGKYSAVRNLF